MSLYAAREMEYMDRVIDMIDGKDPNDDPKRFEHMNVLDQRREMAYYIADHKYAMQTALNDEMDWTALARAWQAADVAECWHLIDRAMARSLKDEINKANGVES